MHLLRSIPVCTSGVDMVFVLDGSASVVSFRFRNMLTTVVATAQAFWSSYPQSRLAIITYASGVTHTVPLADVANQTAFSAGKSLTRPTSVPVSS